MQCNQCRHFEPVGRIAAGSKTDGGFCKAHPPHPIISPQGVGYTFVPIAATEYCGEFAPRAGQETGQETGQDAAQGDRKVIV